MRQHRCVEHGLLSVGLKLHHLGDGHEFCSLVERLGGASKVDEINRYRHTRASLCLVLPPVGNARAAILILECIERFIGCQLFGNREIQIQVCSPGRLDARRSALLAIGFYLGSDKLRRYALGDLETTFSGARGSERGQRLVIYDAGGDFDRGFEWWACHGTRDRLARRQLPFENGRSDLLTGSGSRLDIENVNLLATLLVHAQYKGYWGKLGEWFAEDMRSLLNRHLLAGLLDAPWIHTGGPEKDGDATFRGALHELVAYAFEESARVMKTSRAPYSRAKGGPTVPLAGILYEMQSLLKAYRAELVTQALLQGKGVGT